MKQATSCPLTLGKRRSLFGVEILKSRRTDKLWSPPLQFGFVCKLAGDAIGASGIVSKRIRQRVKLVTEQ